MIAFITKRPRMPRYYPILSSLIRKCWSWPQCYVYNPFFAVSSWALSICFQIIQLDLASTYWVPATYYVPGTVMSTGHRCKCGKICSSSSERSVFYRGNWSKKKTKSGNSVRNVPLFLQVPNQEAIPEGFMLWNKLDKYHMISLIWGVWNKKKNNSYIKK